MSANDSHFLGAIRRNGIPEFPHFFVGNGNLAQLATRDDRVCVLNILGNESRTVTPVSHTYSGGNVVCGVQPGRSGSVLKTELNDIPVYNTVSEALDAGHRFNIAVVYVPPAGVKDAVIEAVRVNPVLTRVVILTEKVPLSDARIIRQYCQIQGVDVFGGNCLGIADAHHHVRIGGALGGTHPAESLVPGTVAIYSNSGNFTTTIAVYLLTAGWGTTVSLSSGKDVYIHFAAAEFTNAFHNDRRSHAAVMYIEPGGYYERDLVFEKPVIACIVGRWKDRLTKACGHAGAIAGSGDNAAAKERWFMEKLGVDAIYTADNPVFSAKGAVVTNIADIPSAMTAVMALNRRQPDFEPIGDLSMKCWFADDSGLALPPELDVKPVPAVDPYREQIEAVNRQIGTIPPREVMKDASGASMMDPETQITRLHGISILDVATRSYEENLVLALVREYPDDTGRALANVALNAYVDLHGTPMLAAAHAAREAGSSPNTALCAAVALIGPNLVEGAQRPCRRYWKSFGNRASRPDRSERRSRCPYRRHLRGAGRYAARRRAGPLGPGDARRCEDPRRARDRNPALPDRLGRRTGQAPERGRGARRHLLAPRLEAAVAQADLGDDPGQPALASARRGDHGRGIGESGPPERRSLRRRPGAIPDRWLELHRDCLPGLAGVPARCRWALRLLGAAWAYRIQRPRHHLGPGREGCGQRGRA